MYDGPQYIPNAHVCQRAALPVDRLKRALLHVKTSTHVSANSGIPRHGMIKAMLLVKETGGERWKDKGSREFAVLPRVGEHVEHQDGTQPAPASCDG
jgi:hypothetical protein